MYVIHLYVTVYAYTYIGYNSEYKTNMLLHTRSSCKAKSRSQAPILLGKLRGGADFNV